MRFPYFIFILLYAHTNFRIRTGYKKESLKKMRSFPPKNYNNKSAKNSLRKVAVNLRQKITVFTVIFEMRHQATNSVNNFLRSTIAKKKMQCWETPFKDADRRCNGALPCVVRNLLRVYSNAIYFLRIFYCHDHILSYFLLYYIFIILTVAAS